MLPTQRLRMETHASRCAMRLEQFIRISRSPRSEKVLPPPPLSPVLWKDWPRCQIRREWLNVVRRETVIFVEGAPLTPLPVTPPAEEVLTRSQRAHWRLSWEWRLARNARPSDAPSLTVTLHGLPATFAHAFGFDLFASA